MHILSYSWGPGTIVHTYSCFKQSRGWVTGKMPSTLADEMWVMVRTWHLMLFFCTLNGSDSQRVNTLWQPTGKHVTHQEPCKAAGQEEARVTSIGSGGGFVRIWSHLHCLGELHSADMLQTTWASWPEATVQAFMHVQTACASLVTLKCCPRLWPLKHVYMSCISDSQVSTFEIILGSQVNLWFLLQAQ